MTLSRVFFSLCPPLLCSLSVPVKFCAVLLLLLSPHSFLHTTSGMLHVSIWEISAGFPIASVKWYWHRYFRKAEAPLQHKSSQYVSFCHWASKFSTDIFAYDYFESAAMFLLTGIGQEVHFSLWFACKPLCIWALNLYVSIYGFVYMQMYLKMDIGTNALGLTQGEQN